MFLLVDVPDIKDLDKRRGMSLTFMSNAGHTRLFRYNYNFSKVIYDCLTFPFIPNFIFFNTETGKLVSDTDSVNYIEDYLQTYSELYLYCVPDYLMDLLKTCQTDGDVYNFLRYFWHGYPFKVRSDGIYFDSFVIPCRIEDTMRVNTHLVKVRALYGVVEEDSPQF